MVMFYDDFEIKKKRYRLANGIYLTTSGSHQSKIIEAALK
jgi:hypothetical protein